MTSDTIRGRQILARLDRLPIWPYRRIYLFIVGIGFFFGFYDILTIGLTLPKIEPAFGVTLTQASWAITSSLIGYIIGSFFISRIADRLGRRISLIISILFFTVGSLACGISFNLNWLIGWRLITGMGIGAEIAVVTTYMEEMSPAPVRGRSTCLAIAFGMIGFAIVPFIAYWLVPHYDFGWRILFLSGAVGGILIYFTRRHLPDSPRWLVIQNKLDRAETIVAAAEERVRLRLGRDLPQVPPVGEYEMIHDTSLANFFHLSILKRVFAFAIIWFVYYIGNYAWLTLAPSLLIKHGFSVAHSIGFVAIASFGFIAGSILSVVFSEAVERKWLAIWIALAWAIVLFIIGWYPTPAVIVIAGFLATTTIAMIIPILYIYTGENFPTRIRATSLSITDGLGHLGGAFCAQIIFSLSALFTQNSYNFTSAFTIMAITGLLTAVLLLPGLKMTHKSLSELEKPK